jgi:hydroxymethylglutaryl-CoA lyase
MNERVTLTETARDAWQGLAHTIPTDAKVEFLQQLLDAGFPSLDIGSFVSTRLVPSMADTAELPSRLELPEGATLTALVASPRGLDRLLECPGIGEVLYPFSLAESFQLRNTKRTREQAAEELGALTVRSHEAGLRMYATISMAFGNNEGDPFDIGELAAWVKRLETLGVDRIGLADTTAQATPTVLGEVYRGVLDVGVSSPPGVHLHATPETQEALVDAALEAGCRQFDTALGGLGGCQFAQGPESNISTLPLVRQLLARGMTPDLPASGVAALERLDACARRLAS